MYFVCVDSNRLLYPTEKKVLTLITINDYCELVTSHQLLSGEWVTKFLTPTN